MAKCEMIDVEAGCPPSFEGFVPAEKHCDREAVGFVEGVVPACWEHMEAMRAYCSRHSAAPGEPCGEFTGREEVPEVCKERLRRWGHAS